MKRLYFLVLARFLFVSFGFIGGSVDLALAEKSPLQLLPKELKGRIVADLDPASLRSLLTADPLLGLQMLDRRMWRESVLRSQFAERIDSYRQFKLRFHQGLHSGNFRVEIRDPLDFMDFLNDPDVQQVARGLIFGEGSPFEALSAVEWAEVISKFENLELLRLGHLSELGTQVVLKSRGIEELKGLREFSCEACFFNPKAVERLGEVLEKLPDLRVLDLTEGVLKGKLQLEKTFKDLGRSSQKLEVLRLDSIQVSGPESAAIIRQLPSFHTLSELSLCSLRLKAVDIEILSRGPGYPKLRVLDLSHNVLGGDPGAVPAEPAGAGAALGRLLLSSPALEVLALRDNGFLGAHAVDFAEGLGRLTELRDLDLSHNSFRDLGSQVLLKALSTAEKLEFLNLGSVHLGDEAMKSLFGLSATWPRLRVLKLKGNSLGGKGLKRLVAGVGDDPSELQVVDLRDNDLGWFGADRARIGELRTKVTEVKW